MAVYSKPKTDFASGLLAYLEKQDAEPLKLFGEEIRQRKAPKKRSRKRKTVKGLRVTRSELRKMTAESLVAHLTGINAGKKTRRRIVGVWSSLTGKPASEFARTLERIKKQERKAREAKEWQLLHASDYNYLRFLPYPDFLESEYWKTVRKVVLRRDDHCCTNCGNISRLDIHHRTYKNRGREHLHLSDLVTLCRKCHSKQHEKPATR